MIFHCLTSWQPTEDMEWSVVEWRNPYVIWCEYNKLYSLNYDILHTKLSRFTRQIDVLVIFCEKWQFSVSEVTNAHNIAITKSMC